MLSIKELRNPDCELCPLHLGASSVCVPGEGSGSLPVMILGEAPGREEDLRSRPFVGRSGRLLRTSLQKVGLPLSQCYLTNSTKCFPSMKGTPTRDEMAECVRNYLWKEISLLKPRLLLTLGRLALSAVTTETKISDVRGEILLGFVPGKPLIFPVWHPAYVLRDLRKLAEWEADLEKFVRLVEVECGFGATGLSES
jgi:uracil-DNA glycosylase